ncbi:lytic murein transglycosylase [Aliiroseovarius marinus]|uniref:lytic murein transglycosylase n=1 Tax=Aliiroseovarius marinus TaxID=2500159 RepID=UPI003D7C90C9
MSGQSTSQFEGFESWVVGFRDRALATGVSERTLDLCWPRLLPDPRILEKQSHQAEFTLTICAYLDRVVSAKRVKDGRASFRAHRSLLVRIADRYRVDAAAIMAIWGVETNYGRTRGDWSTLGALTSLAHSGHRADFFESELLAALSILDAGDITPAAMVGSWAGAMGHGQFMPSSYHRWAVDFDRDGRRDIWQEDPTDGLASIANYLWEHGWRLGAPWGVELGLPAGFDYSLTGRTTRKTTAEWTALGVTAADGGALGDYGRGSVLLPSGAEGPAFLTYHNFDVLLTYNRAESYGIAVGHLADRLSGGRKFLTRCPEGLTMLTRAEMRELQERLTGLGFDTQGADGFTGPNTQAALRAYQAARGMVPDGVGTGAVLQAIRAAT